MKKQMIQGVAAVMGLALMLTACESKSSNRTLPSLSVPAGQSSAETSEAGDLEAAAEISVKVTTVNKTYTGDFGYGEETIFNLSRQDVQLVEGNEQIARLLTQRNEDVAEFLDDIVSNAIEGQAAVFFANYEYKAPAELEYKAEFRRVDAAVLSIFFTEYAYMGGVHPYFLLSSSNYDCRTGKELEITDVVTDVKAFSKAFVETVKESKEYGEAYKDGAYVDPLDEVTYDLLMDGSLAWAITRDGIELWFGDYQAGSYASGQICLVVPYEKYKDLMNAQYFENVEDYEVTSRVSVDRAQPEKINAFDYCYQERGFTLYDFDLVSGVYEGEDGSQLIIYDGGYYTYTSDGGEEDYLSGNLRVTEAEILMFTDVYDESTYLSERIEVGMIAFNGSGTFLGGLYSNERQVYTLMEKYERVSGGEPDDAWTNPDYNQEARLEGCDVVLFEGVLPEHPFDEVDMGVDEYTRTFWFFADKEIKDLKLFYVTPVEWNEYSAVYEVGEVRFSKAVFTTDDSWLVTISMPGDVPSNGFSYVNAAGETKYFAIGDSGLDGSLYLEEFIPKK